MQEGLSFMNQHVNRRSIMSASAGLAAMALPAAAASNQDADVEAAAIALAGALKARHGGHWDIHNDQKTGLVAVSKRSDSRRLEGMAFAAPEPVAAAAPELRRLKEAFEVALQKWTDKNDLLGEAEKRYHGLIPPQPEELVLSREETLNGLRAQLNGEPSDHPAIVRTLEWSRATVARREAWEAACQEVMKDSGLPDARKADKKRLALASLAADRILRFRARSLADIQLKFEVDRTWDFEPEDFVPAIRADIDRIAKAQRGVSRGTNTVTG
ncbi:Uncharacterized protein MLTONO_0376 [Mesorhizobium loti]|nr:Uncharacterized protein MLTONO_0376 [Mesorhizobium loti]